ncbi:MAG: elongation factor P 5-aminopentanone reductase [Cellulosilyticaceae bacterium]
MNFSNNYVLVTGSSRGIGRSIAEAFCKHGATVILNAAHDLSTLQQTFDDFQSKGYNCFYFLGDMSDYNICKQMFEAIFNKYNQYPTIVVNNAGISHVGLFTDTTPDIWHRVISTNLYSAYNCSYLAVPHMISKQSGIIINISSIWGQYGASCEVAYSTSKSALDGLTRSLSKELAPSSIRVNSIACGWIDTSMNAHFSETEKECFLEDVPLCRTGTPEEVATTCLYLASPMSSYMTGQVLSLDGGLY